MALMLMLRVFKESHGLGNMVVVSQTLDVMTSDAFSSPTDCVIVGLIFHVTFKLEDLLDADPGFCTFRACIS